MGGRLAVAWMITMIVAGCSTSTDSTSPPGDGAVRHLCGKIINEPAAGMEGNVGWFHDLAQTATPVGFSLPASGTFNYRLSPWLQVSSDCSDGAAVDIQPSDHARIVDQVRSGAGTYAAVRLYAYAPGIVEVIVRHDGAVVSTTRIHITSPVTN